MPRSAASRSAVTSRDACAGDRPAAGSSTSAQIRSRVGSGNSRSAPASAAPSASRRCGPKAGVRARSVQPRPATRSAMASTCWAWCPGVASCAASCSRCAGSAPPRRDTHRSDARGPAGRENAAHPPSSAARVVSVSPAGSGSTSRVALRHHATAAANTASTRSGGTASERRNAACRSASGPGPGSSSERRCRRASRAAASRGGAAWPNER